TTTYTLTATNAAGTIEATTTIAVVAAGNVQYVRLFGTGEADYAEDIVVHPTTGNLITLNFTNGTSVSGTPIGDRHFFGVHSVGNGALSEVVSIEPDTGGLTGLSFDDMVE